MGGHSRDRRQHVGVRVSSVGCGVIKALCVTVVGVAL